MGSIISVNNYCFTDNLVCVMLQQLAMANFRCLIFILLICLVCVKSQNEGNTQLIFIHILSYLTLCLHFEDEELRNVEK